MAEITDTGYVLTGLPEWVESLQDDFRAVFGAQLEFDPASVQQQMIGILAEYGGELDQGVVGVGNGLSWLTSRGYQMDALGTALSFGRQRATHTSVTLTLTGVSGTIVPAESVVGTDSNILFTTDADATIAAGGFVSVEATAVQAGAIIVAASTVNRIFTVVDGWETVNNVAVGIVGDAREADPRYRVRHGERTMLRAVGPLDAVKAAVGEVKGVTKVQGYSNDTVASNTIVGITLAAHMTYIIVQGGSDLDIANTIYVHRTGGGPTHGSVTVDIPRGTWTTPVSFDRPTGVPVAVTVAIQVRDGFPTNGQNLVRLALLEVVQDLGIGAPLYVSDMIAAVLTVPSTRVLGELVVGRVTGDDPVTTVSGNELFTLDNSNINLTVP